MHHPHLAVAALAAALAVSACGDDTTPSDSADDVGTTDVIADAGDAGASDATGTDGGDDAGATDTASDADDTTDDTDPGDVALDATDAGDALDGGGSGADADAGPPRCDVPTPGLSDAPEAVALAADPARCGQPAYTWLDDPSLGDVIAVNDTFTWPAILLNSAASELNLTTHRPFTRDVVMHQLSYVTQDRGALTDATALVAVPADATLDDEPLPMVLVLHGTSGYNDTCAVSNTIEWQILTALFASWGYVAVSPDFIGMRAFGESSTDLHPYLMGEPTAMASLDAARAAMKHIGAGALGDTCAAPRVVSWGGSQGGHAALVVDRYAPWYAPELAYVGTAAVIPPADVVGQTTRSMREAYPGTVSTLAIFAAASQWYEQPDTLDDILAPGVADTLLTALGSPCGGDLPVDPSDFETLEDVFTPEALQIVAEGSTADLPFFGCVAEESGLTTTSVPRATDRPAEHGILFVQAGEDELVDVPTERTAFATLCTDGDPITYLECADALHTQGAFWSLPETGRFIDARMAGEVFVGAEVCEAPAAVVCEGTVE